jgi:hypothetical protein
MAQMYVNALGLSTYGLSERHSSVISNAVQLLSPV